MSGHIFLHTSKCYNAREQAVAEETLANVEQPLPYVPIMQITVAATERRQNIRATKKNLVMVETAIT